MKAIIYSVLICFSALNFVFAQQLERKVISTQGGSQDVSGRNFSYTIGESFISTNYGAPTLTKGFQQPVFQYILNQSGITLHKVEGSQNQGIEWSVTDNMQWVSFSIEKSISPDAFEVMQTIEAVPGRKLYQIPDLNINFPTMVKFRVRGLLNNGQILNSNIIELSPYAYEWKFSIYPQPTTEEYCNLQFHLNTGARVSLQIFNTQGISRINIEKQFPAGPQNWKLDIKKLPSGIYHVVLEQNEKMFSQILIRY